MMRSFGRRRTGVVAAAGGLAGLLACASVAMACIPYMGKMEVEGIGDGASSVEVVGSGRGMSYCPDEPYGPSASLPNPGGVGTFKLNVAPTTNGDCASQLLGHHGVRFWSGAPAELSTSEDDYKCFPWNPGSQPVGDLLVDVNGNGEGVYNIPAGAAPGYGAVCLINVTAGFLGGHRAPILLL